MDVQDSMTLFEEQVLVLCQKNTSLVQCSYHSEHLSTIGHFAPGRRTTCSNVVHRIYSSDKIRVAPCCGGRIWMTGSKDSDTTFCRLGGQTIQWLESYLTQKKLVWSFKAKHSNPRTSLQKYLRNILVFYCFISDHLSMTTH